MGLIMFDTNWLMAHAVVASDGNGNYLLHERLQ